MMNTLSSLANNIHTQRTLMEAIHAVWPIFKTCWRVRNALFALVSLYLGIRINRSEKKVFLCVWLTEMICMKCHMSFYMLDDVHDILKMRSFYVLQCRFLNRFDCLTITVWLSISFPRHCQVLWHSWCDVCVLEHMFGKQCEFLLWP